VEDKKKSGAAIGGVVMVGCMFIGGGIGMLYHNVRVGGAIGMGIGFVAMGAIWAYYRDK